MKFIDGKIPIGWSEVKMGSLVKVGRGSSPRPIHNYLSENGIPWVKIADATSSMNKYIESTKQFIIEEGRSTSVKPGDLIVSNSATPGIPKIMAINACVHDGWLVFDDYKNIDKLYLYYFFLFFRKTLNHSASGSVFKNLKTDIVRNIDLILPDDLQEQKAIAQVLTAFDDKIENLQAQNQTLETLAQTIFAAWFGKYQVGDELPEGWRVGTLGEEFEIVMGQSPRGTSYNEIGNGTLFFQGRAEFTERFPSERLYTTEPKRMAEVNDILVSVRAPVGDVNVADKECCIGRGLAAVKSTYKSYALYKILSLKPQFDLFESEGTVFGSINKNSFSNIEVIIAEHTRIVDFDIIGKGIDNKIFKNHKQIQTLTQTRDTLLPKLMSGELRVEGFKK